jgi:hypothetical protein
MNRTAKCILLIGQNGTGKTHLIINKLLPLRDASLILAPAGDQSWANEANEISHNAIMPDMQGVFSVPMIRKKKYIETVLQSVYFNYHNGYLIFDDANLMFPSNIDNLDYLHEIFGRRRQKMIDIIITAHSFRDLNPGFFSYASDIILYKTSDSPTLRKRELADNYEMAMNVFRDVADGYKSNPYYNRVINLR